MLKASKVLALWLQISNSLSCDFSSLLSLFLAHVNSDKELDTKLHGKSHVRKGLRLLNHLALF